MATYTHIEDKAAWSKRFAKKRGVKFLDAGWYDKDTGKKDNRPGRSNGMICMPMIISDNVEYKSTITGEMITSRSQHREHLRRHGCVEVGTDKPKAKPSKEMRAAELKKSLRKDLKEAIDMHTQGFRNAPSMSAESAGFNNVVATNGAVTRADTPKASLIT